MMLDLNKALETLTRDVALDTSPIRGGGGSQHYDLKITSPSMDFHWDLADSWVTKNRWRMLTTQYLNAEHVDNWLNLIEAKMPKAKEHGVAFLRSNTVKPRGTKRISRQWGSCMLGWSFRVFPTPHLVMHSRSTYLGFLAPLDLAVGARLGQLAAERVGLTLDGVGFTWFLEQATFHGFRSMPWWFINDKHQAAMRDNTTSLAAKKTRAIVARFTDMDTRGLAYADVRYAQEARYRQAWHQAVGIDTSQFYGPGIRGEVSSDLKIEKASIWDLPLVMSKSDDSEAESGFYKGAK